jgi:predicted AAA+ superfamily ATPase
MIQRTLQEIIKEKFFKGKVILLFGPRQAGKSTLVEMILNQINQPFFYLNGDEPDVRDLLSSPNSVHLKNLVGQNPIVFIDEAQRIPNIGLTLKLFSDQLKEVQVIASGSSAFELSNKVSEPLTGRKYEFLLYPFSFQEMVEYHGKMEEKRNLEQRLLYGYYPEIVNKPFDAQEHIRLIADSYLYKDLLMLEQIKKPLLLDKILKALAFQIGSEVNYHELSQVVGADKETVEKYIDLLEKTFVIFRLPALNRNVRNELKKGKKIYFLDCGIRNAIINNFTPLQNRNDTGALWENFMIAERRKNHQYVNPKVEQYFWRTTQQQEIDLIEIDGEHMSAFEFKWNEKTKVRFSQTFSTNYPNTEFHVISPKGF